MIDYFLKVNPHTFRVGIIRDSNPVEVYYRQQQHLYGIVNTEDELKKLIREAINIDMGQKVNPHGLRVGVYKDWDSKWIREDELDINGDDYMGQKVNPHGLRVRVHKDWDSKWYPENNDNFYISNDLVHHSLENRKIHLVKILGKKKYKKVVNKVKTLSR